MNKLKKHNKLYNKQLMIKQIYKIKNKIKLQIIL